MPLDFSEAGTSVSLSPLFLPTPAKPSAPKAITSKRDGRVQVAVRIKPPADHESESCLTWAGGNSVTFEQPEVENEIMNGPSLTPKRCATPSRAQTPARRIPGSILKTAGRTPGGVRTPAGRTPVGRTPVGRTPGARTPGGRTPGLPEAPKRFEYDSVCGPECEQEDVFAYAQPLVEAALTGSNACVLAYGQTGSGKTHSMVGNGWSPGLVPRIADHLFDALTRDVEASSEDDGRAASTATISCLEIYNENIKDLLTPPPARLGRATDRWQSDANRKQPAGLKLRSGKGGTYVAGLTQQAVASSGQMFDVIDLVMANRQTAATSMNDASSRR